MLVFIYYPPYTKVTSLYHINSFIICVNVNPTRTLNPKVFKLSVGVTRDFVYFGEEIKTFDMNIALV